MTREPSQQLCSIAEHTQRPMDSDANPAALPNFKAQSVSPSDHRTQWRLRSYQEFCLQFCLNRVQPGAPPVREQSLRPHSTRTLPNHGIQPVASPCQGTQPVTQLTEVTAELMPHATVEHSQQPCLVKEPTEQPRLNMELADSPHHQGQPLVTPTPTSEHTQLETLAASLAHPWTLQADTSNNPS